MHTTSKIQLYPRAEIRGLVLVRNNELLLKTELGNISVSGVLVRPTRPFDKEQLSLIKSAWKHEVEVQLTIQASQFCEALGLTAHIVRIASKKEAGENGGIALSFTEVSERAKKALFEGVLEARTESILNR